MSTATLHRPRTRTRRHNDITETVEPAEARWYRDQAAKWPEYADYLTAQADRIASTSR